MYMCLVHISVHMMAHVEAVTSGGLVRFVMLCDSNDTPEAFADHYDWLLRCQAQVLTICC